MLEASSPSLPERGLGGEVNWRAWYWVVLGALAVEVVFFAYLTRAFAV